MLHSLCFVIKGGMEVVRRNAIHFEMAQMQCVRQFLYTFLHLMQLLAKHHDFATLCQLFKIVHNLCSSPNPYNPHPRPGLRNLNNMALDTPFCRLSLTQKSFYPYTPTLWNHLPDSTVKCPTLTAFKSAISQLFC